MNHAIRPPSGASSGAVHVPPFSFLSLPAHVSADDESFLVATVDIDRSVALGVDMMPQKTENRKMLFNAAAATAGTSTH